MGSALKHNLPLFAGAFVAVMGVGGAALVGARLYMDKSSAPSATPPVASVDPVDAERAQAEAEARAETAAHDKRVATYRTWSPAQREATAAEQARNSKASGSIGNELAEASATDQERRNVIGLFNANRAAVILATPTAAQDPVGVAAAAAKLLTLSNIKHIKRTEKTSVAEAKKDPAGNQGKWIEVSGTIVQIRRIGETFHGLLMTPGLKPISFATCSPTKGIVEDSQATFVGLLVSDYNFPNVSGGETQSLMLAGHFTGQGQD